MTTEDQAAACEQAPLQRHSSALLETAKERALRARTATRDGAVRPTQVMRITTQKLGT